LRTGDPSGPRRVLHASARDGAPAMEECGPRARAGWFRSRSRTRIVIAGGAIGGGAIVVLGACLPWFSLFAGLHPYRGIDVVNGRLLAAGGGLSIVAGACFAVAGGLLIRWGIGLLGYVLLAVAGWSAFQLRVIYRQLATDPFVVARLGPGLTIVAVGALLIFATLFLGDE
jgi:hypothetical protein